MPKDAGNTVPSDVDHAMSGGAERRQQVRHATHWQAHCTGPDGTAWDVVIIDASEGGFGLSGDLPIAVDAQVEVAVGDVGVFPCRVAWKGGGRCGLQLLDEAAVMSEDQSVKLVEFLV